MPIDRIRAMLALADDPASRLFPPTELYSEGWMLRLVDRFRNNISTQPL